jgi:hypothetical protein
MRDPIIVQGRLGWGNRKPGYEAYGPGGRWGGQGDQGDLLGDALTAAGGVEGMGLVVVAIDRFADLDALAHAITAAVEQHCATSTANKGDQ